MRLKCLSPCNQFKMNPINRQSLPLWAAALLALGITGASLRTENDGGNTQKDGSSIEKLADDGSSSRLVKSSGFDPLNGLDLDRLVATEFGYKVKKDFITPSELQDESGRMASENIPVRKYIIGANGKQIERTQFYSYVDMPTNYVHLDSNNKNYVPRFTLESIMPKSFIGLNPNNLVEGNSNYSQSDVNMVKRAVLASEEWEEIFKYHDLIFSDIEGTDIKFTRYDIDITSFKKMSEAEASLNYVGEMLGAAQDIGYKVLDDSTDTPVNILEDVHPIATVYIPTGYRIEEGKTIIEGVVGTMELPTHYNK